MLLMDISMRELNGIDATMQILAQAPGTRVLILSMHSAEEFVRRALPGLGACGYLVKDSAPQELSLALAARGGGEDQPSSRSSVPRRCLSVQRRALFPRIPFLMPRQCQVLQLIAEGAAQRRSPRSLDLSVKTVETHRAALMARLGIFEVAGLVMYAARKSPIPVDGGRG